MITPDHVLIGYRPEDLFLLSGDGGRHSIPFDTVFRPEKETTAKRLAPETLPDEDYQDLVVIRVEVGYTNWGGLFEPVDLNTLLSTPADVQVGTPLISSGYPGELRAIDYDAYRIRIQRAVLPAYDDGRSATGLKQPISLCRIL